MPEFVNLGSTAAASNQLAVVFVHGFAGNARKPRRRIPDFLQGMSSLGDWDLLGFGYQSNQLFDLVDLWSADPRLEEIAIVLHPRPEIAPAKCKSVTFVAHRSAEGLEKLQKASQQRLEAWEAQSMEEQAIRVADLCGLSEEESKRFANFYEGEEA